MCLFFCPQAWVQRPASTASTIVSTATAPGNTHGQWAVPCPSSAASIQSAAEPSSPSRRQVNANNGSSSSAGSPGRQHWRQQHSTPPLASLVNGLSSPTKRGPSSASGSVGPDFSRAVSVSGSVASSSFSQARLQGWGSSQPGADGEAGAYYAAQQAALLSKSTKVGSNFKQHRGERGTFSLASRSSAAGMMQP